MLFQVIKRGRHSIATLIVKRMFCLQIVNCEMVAFIFRYYITLSQLNTLKVKYDFEGRSGWNVEAIMAFI